MFGIGFTEIRDFLTDPQSLIALVAAVLVFATIVTLSAPALSTDKLDKRIKSVNNRREELRRKSREAMEAEARGGKGSIRGAEAKGGDRGGQRTTPTPTQRKARCGISPTTTTRATTFTSSSSTTR